MYWALDTDFMQNDRMFLGGICNVLEKVTKRIWKTHNTE